ncbi:MAG: T9SS type A sorting domain-containing protein [Saprospiraceae bacterium]|nr:T9SS type A sorting domain-containing protein [Saprospiraceae bacterium]
MKKLLIVLCCCVSGVLFGNVESVELLMKYNCETNEYDAHLVIMEGSATDIPGRAQFNAQITIVVPTGESFMITELHMPLQNNQGYEGTVPMPWNLGNPALAPEAQPESDFYPLTPTLSPASFYNNLEEGDEVKLFSFVVGSSGQFDDRVRFYKNGEDPIYSDPGMGGGNYSIGIAIGGANQLYSGSSVESCVTSTNGPLALEVEAYPNPFQDKFTIGLSSEAKSIEVMGSNGQLFFQSRNIKGKTVTIDANTYPSGVYYIQVSTEMGIQVKKIVKY